MAKRKLLLLVVLAAVMAVACAMFVACGKKTAKHTIKWTVDSQVTVKVADYKEPPTEAEENTVINFTLEFENGYELGTISGAKAADSGYTFTVGTKDVEVKITAIKSIASLEVTNPVNSYYAGETVDLSEVSVKVNYVVGDPETVSGDKCVVAYQSGDSFSLGDTKYTVKYGRGAADVTLDSAVLGLVTLKLNGGTLSADEFAKLPEGAVESDGEVSWTFAEALEEDLVLPEPVLELTGGNLLLDRWSGVEDNTIPAGTDTSITAVAVYESKLVEVKNMEFTSKDGVPYLVISGELIAGDSAYLMLCEGNDVEKGGANVKYDKLTYAVKAEGSNEFTLELNLAEMASATKDNGLSPLDPEKESAYNLKGPWLDLRFVVISGELEVQQELFISDDSTYANIADSVVAKVGEKWYTFSYKTWSPQKGDAITGGNGAEFTGDENILKLYYEDSADVVVTGAELEVKDNVAYLVLNGQYLNISGEVTKDVVDAYLQKLIETEKTANDCSIEGFSYWDRATTTRNYTVNDDLSWTISFALDGTLHNHGYYVHFLGNNLMAKTIPSTVTVGDIEYTLLNENGKSGESWTFGLVWVNVIDLTKSVFTMDSVALEAENDKVYLVYSGSYSNYTKAQLEEFVIDIEGGERKLLDITVEMDEENGTFTMKADISDKETYPVSDFCYMHGAFLEEDQTLSDLGDKANISASTCAIVKGKETVTVNGFTYTLDEQWGTRGVRISAVATDAE